MASRKLHPALALTLALSAGALPLARAEAAPVRSGPPDAAAVITAVIQTPLSSSSFLQALENLWGLLKDEHQGPPHRHDPHGPSNREGTGICPHGHM